MTHATITMDLSAKEAMPVSFGRQVKTYLRGRVCQHPGCGTVLSIYNSGKYCGVHWAQNKGGKRKELKPRG
ncbi:MAG: hypothetical protein WC318_07140 [Candidatus Omnitrophota bacterium]|jgi:hypothetical protein